MLSCLLFLIYAPNIDMDVPFLDLDFSSLIRTRGSFTILVLSWLKSCSLAEICSKVYEEKSISNIMSNSNPLIRQVFTGIKF